jgi:putative transcriptional regulator
MSHNLEHARSGVEKILLLKALINKPSDLSMRSLFEKVELPLHRADLLEAPVLKGGPVHTERGFVLHEAIFVNPPTGSFPMQDGSDPVQGNLDLDQPGGLAKDTNPLKAESVYASTMMIPGGLEMTTSKDVLEALSTGAGPRKVLISLGYSAWSEGQLESELAENSWLTVGADVDVIFDTPIEERYERAMGLLGLQSWMLSSEAGHS